MFLKCLEAAGFPRKVFSCLGNLLAIWMDFKEGVDGMSVFNQRDSSLAIVT